MRRSLSLASVLIAVAVPLHAQNFPIEEVETLAAENARAYLRPATEGLGHALTAGFAETAHSHRLFGFDLGVRVMASLPSQDAKMFTAILPESIEYAGVSFNNPYRSKNGNLETPTIMGPDDEDAHPGVVLTPNGSYRDALVANGENPEDYNIEFPAGLNLPAVPFALLQTSVGLPFDTEFTFRFIPSVTPTEDVGSIRAYGFGLKHTVSRWLPSAPVDVALFAGTQGFAVGETVTARANTYGMIVSRALGPLTAFAHVRSSSASVSMDYTIDYYDDEYNNEEYSNDNPGLPADGTRIGFDTNLPSVVRAGGGLTIRVVGIALTGEYTTLGGQNTVSLKTGISVR
jgi:hypothetical protein